MSRASVLLSVGITLYGRPPRVVRDTMIKLLVWSLAHRAEAWRLLLVLTVVMLEFGASSCQGAQERHNNGFANYGTSSFMATYDFTAEDASHRLHGTLTWYRAG